MNLTTNGPLNFMIVIFNMMEKGPGDINQE